MKSTLTYISWRNAMNNQKNVRIKAVSLIILIALASLSMSFAQDTSEEEVMNTNKELTRRFFERCGATGM